MPSQRPYFLSSFIAAFRQQQNHPLQSSQQPNKQTSTSTAAASTSSYSQTTTSASAPRTISPNASSTATPSSSSAAAHSSRSQSAGVAIHSPRGSASSSHGIPIPSSGSPGRRRGSDSSSEGFRDVLGADKWYIGGKTATGEEKFFKLGVVRRIRSNDGLSLDRLSL